MRNLYSNRGGRNDVVRVLVVDDHALFAEALMLTLGIDERIEVVGAASSGIEATRRVRRVSPSTRVVMVTAARSPQIAFHALAAGAERCLTKDTPALKLIDAILDVPGEATVTRLVPREAS